MQLYGSGQSVSKHRVPNGSAYIGVSGSVSVRVQALLPVCDGNDSSIVLGHDHVAIEPVGNTAVLTAHHSLCNPVGSPIHRIAHALSRPDSLAESVHDTKHIKANPTLMAPVLRML